MIRITANASDEAVSTEESLPSEEHPKKNSRKKARLVLH